MEHVDEYLSSRRNFIKTGATAAVAGLAGCSEGGNGGGTSDQSDTGTSTDEPDAEGDGGDQTSTEEGEGTETGTSGEGTDSGQNNSSSSLYEEDEPEAEQQWEERWLESGAYPNEAWIEMENPSEQIPEGNYDFDEFPNLQIFKDIDLYSEENEAVYITWQELDGRISLGAATIETYDNPSTDENTTSDGSHQYTDQSADVERILGEVVEGIDDVSENISDEYAQILQNS